jgi:hypothetical protein
MVNKISNNPPKAKKMISFNYVLHNYLKNSEYCNRCVEFLVSCKRFKFWTCRHESFYVVRSVEPGGVSPLQVDRRRKTQNVFTCAALELHITKVNQWSISVRLSHHRYLQNKFDWGIVKKKCKWRPLKSNFALTSFYSKPVLEIVYLNSK